LSDSKKLKHFIKEAITSNAPQVKKEDSKLIKEAYELYLRDVALTKIYNHKQLFKSDYTFADEYHRINTDYPELKLSAKIMDALDYRANNSGHTNLAVRDGEMDADQIDTLYENIQDLTKAEKVREMLPGANDQDVKEIMEYFKSFPLVASLQSGMNTHTTFSLTPFVDSSTRTRILEKSIKRLTSLMDVSQKLAEKGEAAEPKLLKYLETFTTAFAANNSDRGLRVRGKDYSTGITLEDMSTMDNLDLDAADKRFFINDTFDVEEIQGRIKKSYPQTIVLDYGGWEFNTAELQRVAKNMNGSSSDPTIADQREFKYSDLRGYGMSDSEYKFAKKNETLLYNILDAAGDNGSGMLLPEIINGWLSENVIETDTYQTDLFRPTTIHSSEVVSKTISQDDRLYTLKGESFDEAGNLIDYVHDRVFLYESASDNQLNAKQGNHALHGKGENVLGLLSRKTYGLAKINPKTQEFVSTDGHLQDIQDPTNKAVSKIDPAVKQMIDENITDLLNKKAELEGAGKTLSFNREGYGQYMIGAGDTHENITQAQLEDLVNQEIVADILRKPGAVEIDTNLEPGSRNKRIVRGYAAKRTKGKQTFLYLSEQLLEHFDYINPGYLEFTEGRAMLQKGQPLTDAELGVQRAEEVQEFMEKDDQSIIDYMKNCLIP